MKAGDAKKFCTQIISSDRRDNINPRDYGINDNFILQAFAAYQKGEPADHIAALIDGFITTENLTVNRRTAVLNMFKDVLTGLSAKDLTTQDRERLRSLLTAYFI